MIAFSRAAREQPSVYVERPLLIVGGDEDPFATATAGRSHYVDGDPVN